MLVENSDVAIISGYMVDKIASLEHTQTRLVIHLHDSLIFEDLKEYQLEPLAAQQAINEHSRAVFSRLLQVGDFYVCSNESQRNFWLGALAASGRINPLTFQKDASLRNLIDVAGESHQAPCERLERYCLEGAYAPDRTVRTPTASAVPGEPSGRLARALYIWRAEGPRAMLHRIRRYLIWRLSHL
jgi:hypothetical protein